MRLLIRCRGRPGMETVFVGRFRRIADSTQNLKCDEKLMIQESRWEAMASNDNLSSLDLAKSSQLK
jgi:hypothetical protein